MNTLEMRTVVFSVAFSSGISVLAGLSIWRQSRSRFSGLDLWVIGASLQVPAVVLLVLRGSIADFFALTVGNGLLLAGVICLHAGCERFLGRSRSQLPNWLVFMGVISVHSYFTFIEPSLRWRSVVVSIGLGVVFGQSAWLMLRGATREMRAITRGVGYIYVYFLLISLVRIFIDLFFPSSTDLLTADAYTVVVMVAYQLLLLTLSFSIFLMVNSRLNLELARDRDVTRLRLVLWEYGINHTSEELMQKALDEIGVLIHSPIGFYHFIDEDQNTLTLQAWSTRTEQEFCRAEGWGAHYDIAQAGIWGQALHARQTVIHNDYASLPERKGLPAGHAPVIRELVVPVLREGRVVSLLGVGNKASPYDESDVELVSYIADLVWTVVERKRNDERIRELNARLEQQAMTDELTGAFNRRSFFRQGAAEFQRFTRYQTPFSLLLLDFDVFKVINDTYGHDAGDEMLRCVVRTLQQNIRSSDVLARLGGEEFGILLPNTTAADAGYVAEKLRRAIESQICASANGDPMQLTISIGVTTAENGIRDFDALLKQADTAMYRAKNQGGNRVAGHGPWPVSHP